MRRVPDQKCSVDGCDNLALKRKDRLCMKHRARLARVGGTSDSDLKYGPNGRALAWLKDHITHTGSACLNWPFGREKGTGHGVVWFEGRSQIASRVMCRLSHGEPPTPDHDAAHNCGKGHEACVNPDHLRWATTVENHADRWIHGTMNIGERNGNAHLTADQVRIIRSSPDRTLKDLSREFGVSKSTIGRARRGECWKHLETA
jgi:hypothetical protein